jgi:DNA-binding winged helix-turn-helix (wHTH) protein/tetratricopeptide (TPR) repeat protein
MPSYRFDRYELDSESRRLLLDGRDLVVGLRVFDVIAYLVNNRHRAIGRDELIAAVWGRTEAGDALLAQAVLKARRAFGDDGNAQHHIRTVPRFGYQWIAETQPLETSAPVAERAQRGRPGDVGGPGLAAREPPAPPSISTEPPRAISADLPRRPTRPRVLALLALLLLGLGLAVVVARRNALLVHAPFPVEGQPSPGLILVVPTQVQSTVAEDGWMRLGVMSLSAHVLGDVPGHTVVPDETALAAAAQAGAPADIARLRATTGADLVITSEASHVGKDWVLTATVFASDGGTQMVSAKATDPIAAAGGLAGNLHDLLSPEGSRSERESLPPDVLALDARMKAAILEGQNGRALALFDAAASDVATAPTAILLRAEALIQLGRTDEAVTILGALIDRAITTAPAPNWLASAWSALGDCELARGRADLAEAHFRRSLDLLGSNGDRRSSGLAWRGLGIAQIIRNDLDQAEASYLQARLELEPIGDRLVLARITDGLGYIAAQRGRMGDALLLYEQAASMGATFGANETELGSRLNMAQSHEYLLHHATALELLRTLLPRLHRLDYPALHRFGLVAYATTLAETGALTAAARELATLTEESASRVEHDAVVDVRLDEARVRFAMGDVEGALRQAEAVRASLDANSTADLRLETVALLLQAQTTRDETAARALMADVALWQPANASPPARVHALVAQAQWRARQGDGAAAADGYRQALALARAFGTPVVLRDAAVPYAQFQLAHADLDGARATGSTLGPYAEEDFASALLLARLAAASRNATLAGSYFTRARNLAGERWTAALAAEASAALNPPRSPPTLQDS